MKNYHQKNNGDGIIDAGETIDLALVLRNRWGMSKDTIVTIDSISDGGVPNPHVEFVTNDINFQGGWNVFNQRYAKTS